MLSWLRMVLYMKYLSVTLFVVVVFLVVLFFVWGGEGGRFLAITSMEATSRLTPSMYLSLAVNV